VGLLVDPWSYAMTSPDGRYVIITTKDTGVLGIPGSQDVNGTYIYNAVRVKTGL
jgi:hypothetical protein